MKLYIVTSGIYSSVGNEGIFSDKCEAERVAELFDNGSIEEFELDQMKGAERLSVFQVMIGPNGDLISCSGPYPMVMISKTFAATSETGLWFKGVACSEGEALKVAAEARQDWLRATKSTNLCEVS